MDFVSPGSSRHTGGKPYLAPGRRPRYSFEAVPRARRGFGLALSVHDDNVARIIQVGWVHRQGEHSPSGETLTLVIPSVVS